MLRNDYDKKRNKAGTQVEEEPQRVPPSSSSSSSSSQSSLETQEEDGHQSDYVPDTPSRTSLSQESNDNKEEKNEVVSTPPSNRKQTPPPPNRPPTPTPLISPGVTGKNSGEGRPSSGSKLSRSSSSGQTPPSAQKITTVRPLNKPPPVTPDQFVSQNRSKSPDQLDEDFENEVFRDKVENARLNAQGLPVPTDRVSPVLPKPTTPPTGRVSPLLSKIAAQSHKRKESEKSK